MLQSGCIVDGAYNAASSISYISNRAATDGIILSNANITIDNTACSGLPGFACYPNQGA